MEHTKRPAYVVIGDSLRARIESRELLPGDRLPSERELVEQFSVARMTVRHALELLQEEGIIERRRGRTGGTFVRALPPVLDLHSPQPLLEQFATQHVEVAEGAVCEQSVKAPPVVQVEFGLGADEKVLSRQVLYVAADGQPIAWETSYRLPGDAAPATRREDTLAATTRPSERERARLRLAAGATLQRLTRKYYEGDRVVGVTILAIRSDAAQLRVITEL